MASTVNKTRHYKKALLEALEKTLGVVTPACKKVGINRTTFYNYYNKDKKFAAAVDDLANVALDFAESKLHENINKGSDTAVIFYLKTKGKKRGYIERVETENTHHIEEQVTIFELPDNNRDAAEQ